MHVQSFINAYPEFKNSHHFRPEIFNRWNLIMGELRDDGVSLEDFLLYRWKENAKPENSGMILPIPETAKSYLRFKSAGKEKKIKMAIDSDSTKYPLSLSALFELDEFGSEYCKNRPMIIGEIKRFADSSKLVTYDGSCSGVCNFCKRIRKCAFYVYCYKNLFDLNFTKLFKYAFERDTPQLLVK